jgi:hypothetical protein
VYAHDELAIPESGKQSIVLNDTSKNKVILFAFAAEGSVNMALFYRLGTATIVSLRPIKVSA